MVRILVSSRRPCDSEAFATSSYGTNLAQPLSAATLVSAAVRVVLPWSMWPMVPTFTCGFERSNFSLAMSQEPRALGCVVVALIYVAGITTGCLYRYCRPPSHFGAATFLA